MDKKKPATLKKSKDNQPTQANYSSIKMLPLQVAAACLVLVSSTAIIALAGALAKLLGGVL